MFHSTVQKKMSEMIDQASHTPTPRSKAATGSPQKTQTLLYGESKHVRICDIIGVRWLEDVSMKVLEWRF